jgi:hypothetical protein
MGTISMGDTEFGFTFPALNTSTLLHYHASSMSTTLVNPPKSDRTTNLCRAVVDGP